MAKSGSNLKLLMKVFVGVFVFVLVSLWLWSPAGQAWIENNILEGSYPAELITPQEIAEVLILTFGLIVLMFIVGVPRAAGRRSTKQYQKEVIIYDSEDEYEERDWLEPMRDFDAKLRDFNRHVFDSFQSPSKRKKSSKRRGKSRTDDDWFAPMREFKF